MVATLVAALIVGAGTFYGARLIPRVAQRVAMASAPNVAHTHHSSTSSSYDSSFKYKKYEYGFENTMSRAEALEILGLNKNNENIFSFSSPTDTEIKENYRKLMKDFHSDVTGSTYIALKINEARDVLLQKKYILQDKKGNLIFEMLGKAIRDLASRDYGTRLNDPYDYYNEKKIGKSGDISAHTRKEELPSEITESEFDWNSSVMIIIASIIFFGIVYYIFSKQLSHLQAT